MFNTLTIIVTNEQTVKAVKISVKTYRGNVLLYKLNNFPAFHSTLSPPNGGLPLNETIEYIIGWIIIITSANKILIIAANVKSAK